MAQPALNNKPSVSLASLARAAGLAALAGVIGNVLVWLIGEAIDTMIFPLPIVIFISIIGALVGGVVYYVISRFARNPNRIFTIVSIVFLVLYAYAPINAMSNPPSPDFPVFNLATMIAAQIMHIISGVAAIYFYTRANRT
jgi:Family of unknown function (DUF6069)